jgi:hypothetical protein
MVDFSLVPLAAAFNFASNFTDCGTHIHLCVAAAAAAEAPLSNYERKRKQASAILRQADELSMSERCAGKGQLTVR